MKKPILLALTFTSIIVLAFFVGCKEGPEGPTGPAGADGSNGSDGVAKCGACHDLTTDLKAKIIQYEASIHATGGNFERSTTSCAPCHTHEGYLEILETGADTTVADITDPTPQNCRTCHLIHVNYDLTDFDLRKTDEVTFRFDGSSHDFGNGNVCAQCHQAWEPDGGVPEVGGDSVVVSSAYWGVHHGPQGTMIAGTGGFEIPGSLTYENSYHSTGLPNTCATCHMAAAYGDQAGGHTWNMSYEYHGSSRNNIKACTDCHSSVTDFDRNGVQTEIEELLDSLWGKLVVIGVVDSTDHAVPGTWSPLHGGTLMNYLMVLEDRSDGIHNTKYAKALLTNSIEAL